MVFENFLKLAEVAKDNGYRETYLKKINVIFLQKGNIFFNGSGIYKYEKGRFFPVFTFEKINKATETVLKLLGINKEKISG